MSDEAHKQHAQSPDRATPRAEAVAPPETPAPAMPDPAAGAAEAAGAAGAVPEESALAAQVEDLQGRNLRLQAELENVRKRMARTLDEELRYACLPLMRDLLPVIDNLQRAVESATQHEHAPALLEGVQLVISQLHTVLERHHCTQIEAQDAAFDPYVHEAIAQLPSPDHEPGQVSLVTQPGYQLHDRVIRPAQVIVAAPRGAAAESAEPPCATEGES